MFKSKPFWDSVLSLACAIVFVGTGQTQRAQASVQAAQDKSAARVSQEKTLLSLSQTTPPKEPITFLPPPGPRMHQDIARPAAPPADQLPKSLDDLSETSVRSYELSVKAAASLGIPIAGGLEAGINRRIIVLEQYAIKRIDWQGTRYDYGYAVRFCLTVDNWNSKLKVSLPFLAASAEVGSIQAQWQMHITGLSGEKINDALPSPTELNVEQFVIAKQKLVEIIAAINDSTTKFKPTLIHMVDPVEALGNQYRIAAVQAYALTCIKNGRSLKIALEGIKPGTTDDDGIRGVYRDFAGLESNEAEKPSLYIVEKAKTILGKYTASLVK